MTSIIKFDGYELPQLTEYSVEVSDADAPGSGRSEAGRMNRDRVRGGDDPIIKISVGCTNLTNRELTELMNAAKPESVKVTFFFGEYIEAEMYASNKKVDMKVVGENEQRWNVSFSMTEY